MHAGDRRAVVHHGRAAFRRHALAPAHFLLVEHAPAAVDHHVVAAHIVGEPAPLRELERRVRSAMAADPRGHLHRANVLALAMVRAALRDEHAAFVGERTKRRRTFHKRVQIALITRHEKGKRRERRRFRNDARDLRERLRVGDHEADVANRRSSKVSESLLKSSGAAGVIIKGNGIQVIYGPRVTVIKSNLEDFIASGAKVDVDEDLVVENKKENKVEATKETKSEDACIIVAPIEGKAVSLEEVGDGVFSEGILGKGVAIEPSVGRAVSPVNGTVSTVFDTKHAIGLTSDDGAEVLIHIGLDTVKLNGEYFKTHVKAGEKVKAGDLLVEFDIDAIKKAGYPTITPIIITNTDNYEDVDTIKKGDVKEKDKLVSVR